MCVIGRGGERQNGADKKVAKNKQHTNFEPRVTNTSRVTDDARDAKHDDPSRRPGDKNDPRTHQNKMGFQDFSRSAFLFEP